ncbi:MAG: VOC family protein [Myxococcota bacterium]
MTTPEPVLTPRLVVDGAAEAIEMYQRILGAQCLERFTDSAGRIVHAALSIRGAVFALVDADGIHNQSARDVKSPVILNVMVEDPDETAAAFAQEGGRILIPVGDQFYGYREGRVADKFGHLWIVSRKLEDLSREEITRRLRSMG